MVNAFGRNGAFGAVLKILFQMLLPRTVTPSSLTEGFHFPMLKEKTSKHILY
jgi:hypothetical protein